MTIEYLETVESVRNRSDKTTLNIKTMSPEKLLAPDVAYPEQVKHLNLDVSFGTDENLHANDAKKYLIKDCKCKFVSQCIKCRWDMKYTNTLFKDIVNFKNLKTLKIHDLNLSSDLWTQFAQNSKCLKEISFISQSDLDSEYDQFWFDGEDDDGKDTKDKGLETVLKISTLKKVIFSRLDLPFFPKGPSNIKYLILDTIRCDFYAEEKDEKEKMFSSYYNNISTHTNITNLKICGPDEFKFSALQLEKLKNLKKLEYTGDIDGKDGLNSIKAILKLPKFKKLKIFSLIIKPEEQVETEIIKINGSIKIVKKLNSNQTQLEEIDINISNNDFKFSLLEMFSEISNLKKLKINNASINF